MEDTSNSPYHGFAWSPCSTHVIVDGVSIPLQDSALLVQRVLTEAVAVTHDTPTLGILPFTLDPHLFQHISVTVTFTTFERPSSPPSSFSSPTTFVSSLLNHS